MYRINGVAVVVWMLLVTNCLSLPQSANDKIREPISSRCHPSWSPSCSWSLPPSVRRQIPARVPSASNKTGSSVRRAISAGFDSASHHKTKQLPEINVKYADLLLSPTPLKAASAPSQVILDGSGESTAAVLNNAQLLASVSEVNFNKSGIEHITRDFNRKMNIASIMPHNKSTSASSEQEKYYRTLSSGGSINPSLSNFTTLDRLFSISPTNKTEHIHNDINKQTRIGAPKYVRNQFLHSLLHNHVLSHHQIGQSTNNSSSALLANKLEKLMNSLVTIETQYENIVGERRSPRRVDLLDPKALPVLPNFPPPTTKKTRTKSIRDRITVPGLGDGNEDGDQLHRQDTNQKVYNKLPTADPPTAKELEHSDEEVNRDKQIQNDGTFLLKEVDQLDEKQVKQSLIDNVHFSHQKLDVISNNREEMLQDDPSSILIVNRANFNSNNSETSSGVAAQKENSSSDDRITSIKHSRMVESNSTGLNFNDTTDTRIMEPKASNLIERSMRSEDATTEAEGITKGRYDNLDFWSLFSTPAKQDLDEPDSTATLGDALFESSTLANSWEDTTPSEKKPYYLSSSFLASLGSNDGVNTADEWNSDSSSFDTTTGFGINLRDQEESSSTTSEQTRREFLQFLSTNLNILDGLGTQKTEIEKGDINRLMSDISPRVVDRVLESSSIASDESSLVEDALNERSLSQDEINVSTEGDILTNPSSTYIPVSFRENGQTFSTDKDPNENIDLTMNKFEKIEDKEDDKKPDSFSASIQSTDDKTYNKNEWIKDEKTTNDQSYASDYETETTDDYQYDYSDYDETSTPNTNEVLEEGKRNFPEDDSIKKLLPGDSSSTSENVNTVQEQNKDFDNDQDPDLDYNQTYDQYYDDEYDKGSGHENSEESDPDNYWTTWNSETINSSTTQKNIEASTSEAGTDIGHISSIKDDSLTPDLHHEINTESNIEAQLGSSPIPVKKDNSSNINESVLLGGPPGEITNDSKDPSTFADNDNSGYDINMPIDSGSGSPINDEEDTTDDPQDILETTFSTDVPNDYAVKQLTTSTDLHPDVNPIISHSGGESDSTGNPTTQSDISTDISSNKQETQSYADSVDLLPENKQETEKDTTNKLQNGYESENNEFQLVQQSFTNNSVYSNTSNKETDDGEENKHPTTEKIDPKQTESGGQSEAASSDYIISSTTSAIVPDSTKSADSNPDSSIVFKESTFKLKQTHPNNHTDPLGQKRSTANEARSVDALESDGGASSSARNDLEVDGLTNATSANSKSVSLPQTTETTTVRSYVIEDILAARISQQVKSGHVTSKQSSSDPDSLLSASELVTYRVGRHKVTVAVKNITLHGLDRLSLVEQRSNLDELSLNISFRFDAIRLDGVFDASGAVSQLKQSPNNSLTWSYPSYGNGNISAVLPNITVHCQLDLQHSANDMKLSIESMQLKLTHGKIQVSTRIARLPRTLEKLAFRKNFPRTVSMMMTRLMTSQIRPMIRSAIWELMTESLARITMEPKYIQNALQMIRANAIASVSDQWKEYE